MDDIRHQISKASSEDQGTRRSQFCAGCETLWGWKADYLCLVKTVRAKSIQFEYRNEEKNVGLAYYSQTHIKQL